MLLRRDSAQVGLAEIADCVPVLGVDDREERVAGRGELAGSDVESSYPAVARRMHDRLVQVALREGEGDARGFQVRCNRLRARYPLTRFGGL
jgi:hypothetical protein